MTILKRFKFWMLGASIGFLLLGIILKEWHHFAASAITAFLYHALSQDGDIK